MDAPQIIDALVHDLRSLRFGPPVTHIYNPLEYASVPWARYASRYGHTPKEVMLVGMNPGPFGMVQTGVPFGAVPPVRDWLGIEAPVGKPPVEHPKRPVEGFACRRIEVSGQRLWGWAQDVFGTAEHFFSRFFVFNYCPLSFMEESGRNRTPDKLPACERDPLFAVCDRALRRMVQHLKPRYVVGIGAFAGMRTRTALADMDVSFGHILHPSPASPLAATNWGGKVTAQLQGLGITL